MFGLVRSGRALDRLPAKRGPDGYGLACSRLWASKGLTRIFCEGGAALSASLLLTDLVDEIVGFTAGLVLGAEGWPALGAMGYDRLAEAARFELIRHTVGWGGCDAQVAALTARARRGWRRDPCSFDNARLIGL